MILISFWINQVIIFVTETLAVKQACKRLFQLEARTKAKLTFTRRAKLKGKAHRLHMHTDARVGSRNAPTMLANSRKTGLHRFESDASGYLQFKQDAFRH